LNPRKPRKVGSPPVESALEKGTSSELKAVSSPQVESVLIETGPSSDD